MRVSVNPYCVCVQVAARLKSRVQDLGNSCIQLVQNAGTVQHNPTDNYAKRDLADNAKVVSEKVLLSLISACVACLSGYSLVGCDSVSATAID